MEKMTFQSYVEFDNSSGHQAFISQTLICPSFSLGMQFPVRIPATENAVHG